MTASNLVGNNVIDVSGGAVPAGAAGGILPAQGTVFNATWFFAAGYQEFDEGVEYTLTQADNWVVPSAGAGTMEGATADVLPNSLFRSAKPAFFGDLTWPAVNPDSPTYSIEIIPAGYRFINDAEPGGGGGSSSITTVTGNFTTLNVSP
jgi:hypothetical protein